MKSFLIKVLLDYKDVVYRDLLIAENSRLDTVHHLIKSAFGFKGNEFASFIHENEEWETEVEIPLENLGDEEISMMKDVVLSEIMKEVGDQLSYTYDYAGEWKFYLELIEVKTSSSEVVPPTVVKKHGIPPQESERSITGEDAESILMNAILGDELSDEELGEDPFASDEMDSIDDYEDFL